MISYLSPPSTCFLFFEFCNTGVYTHLTEAYIAFMQNGDGSMDQLVLNLKGGAMVNRS
jgi:hypothetical protein